MDARTRAQKRLKFNPPVYADEKDNEPHQPVLDPYGSIASTVTLDDVKIIKGQFPSGIVQSFLDRTLLFKFWYGVGSDVDFFSPLPFVNGQNVTARTLANFNYWNYRYGSKDWNEYFSFVTTPNWVYTFKKAGLYRIEGSFGLSNTNDSGHMTLYFNSRGPENLQEVRQTFFIEGRSADLPSGTDCTAFVHYESVEANSILTIKTQSNNAGTRIGRYAFLALTFVHDTSDIAYPLPSA